MSLNAPSGAGPSAHPRMQRNLRLLPWWWVLRWAWFGEGIWVIYLTDERGLTLGEALIFEAVFSAVVIATELPTGMIADRFGRRVSLLIGTTSVVFAFLAFGTSSSLWVLLSAYAFFAAAETSFSGADSAMLYDSLKVVGRERDFTKYYGRLNALVMGGIGAFTIVGSLLVNWFPLWVPFLLSAVATTPAILLAWLFTEPPRTEERHAYFETGRRAVALTVRTPTLYDQPGPYTRNLYDANGNFIRQSPEWRGVLKHDVTGSFLHSWSLGGGQGWISGEIGYTWREGAPADQIPLSIDGGWKLPWGGLVAKGSIVVIRSLGNDSPRRPDDRFGSSAIQNFNDASMARTGLSLMRSFGANDRWTVEAGYNIWVWGRSARQYEEPFFGLTRSF